MATSYSVEPVEDPPGASSEKRWGQCRDGRWRAFYANIGPDDVFNIEHPWDPNWWSTDDPEYRDGSRWACRHGWYEHACRGGQINQYDGEYCGLGPSEAPPGFVETLQSSLCEWISEVTGG